MAACQAIGAPQSWPSKMTGSSSSAAATAATSPASSRKVYRSISAGAELPPYPRTSIAATWKPRSEKWAT